MASPYREEETERSKLEVDAAPARRVRRAAAATAAIGVSIGATTPLLGLGAAALGGGVALLGLLLLRETARGAFKGPCPACGATIAEIDAACELVGCPACGEYAAARSGSLRALRDDFVARTPEFPIPLAPELPALPAICAQCGAANAARLVPVEGQTPLARAGSPTYAASDRIVLVPHCEVHRDGAALTPGALRVRSYAFWLGARSSAGAAALG